MTTKDEFLLPAAVLTAALVLNNEKSKVFQVSPEDICSKFWYVYGQMQEKKPEDEGYVYPGCV